MSDNLSRRQLLSTGLAAVGGTLAAGALAAEGDKAPAKGQLNLETLGNLLAALGLKTTKVETRYDFTFPAKLDVEWNMTMSVFLSADEQALWITAWLDELPKSASEVPRTALLRLLSDNDKIGKGIFFAYVASVRKFVLERCIRNENITTASFKNDMLELARTVADTLAHWSVAEWKQMGTSTASNGKDKEKDPVPDDNGPSVLTERGGGKALKTATKDAPEGGSVLRPTRK